MTSQLEVLPRYAPPATVPATAPVARRRAGSRDGAVLFAVFAAVYLVVGYLMYRNNIVYADALSRLGNGYYVLYSRDPHLPAVGFVWNPLPSLVLLPLLPLKAVFPLLVERGLAGPVSSALFMAGSVVLLSGCLGRLGVGRGWRLVLAGIFGLLPLVLLSAGSGLSEAMLLFFTLAIVSSLTAWVHDLKPARLVRAGIALGLAYLTRYEATAAAVAVGGLVLAVGFGCARGTLRQRALVAVNDAALVLTPFVFAFALWSISARVLVDQWFPQFSSQYGNSVQVSNGRSAVQAATGTTTPEVLEYAARQVLTLAPLVLPLLLLAVFVVVRRRRWAALIGPLVLGSVLAFDNLVLLTGTSFGWIRYQIFVLPLVVLLAGVVVAELGPVVRAARPRPWRRLAAGVVALLVAAGAPLQYHVLTAAPGGLAREEGPALRAVFHRDSATPDELRASRTFRTEREIAAYLDGLDLPRGSVLTDTAYAFSIVLASDDPQRFVITSDRDFPAAVRDPAGIGVSYLLVPDPAGARADALGAQYPGLYETGAGAGELVREWTGEFFGGWRLYRVLPG